MTLRLRLVLALVVLLTVGLAIFGFATYSLYAHAQYQRLDDQIASSVNAVTVQLLTNGTTSCTTKSSSSTSTTTTTTATALTHRRKPGRRSGRPSSTSRAGDRATSTVSGR